MNLSTQKSKRARPFIVRGFDVATSAFGPEGQMDNQPDFTELVVPNATDAIVALLTDKRLKRMSANVLFENKANYRSVDVPNIHSAVAAVPELSAIKLKVITNASSAHDLADLRGEIGDVIKRWAEKSRVKGVRGWRYSAVQAPKYAKNKVTGKIEILFDVIVGAAIFYNTARAKIVAHDQPTLAADLAHLRDHLAKTLSTDFESLEYSHAELGKGSLR